MPIREYVSDLAEVLHGVKSDVILTALGSGSDNPQNASGDVKDAISVLTGHGGFADIVGLGATVYAKGVEVLEARSERIEAGIEGAEERGHDLARQTMHDLSVDGTLPDAALRALSDVSGPGVQRPDDRTPDYLDAWDSGLEALTESTKTSSFDELTDQRIATGKGFKAEISDTCEATWGYSSAAKARAAGALEPLMPEFGMQASGTQEHELHTETEPSEASRPGASVQSTAPTPAPNTTDADRITADAGVDHSAPDEADRQLAPSESDLASDSAPDPENHAAPTENINTGVPVPRLAEPEAALAEEPYATGDGDLAAQNQGRDAWVEAEAAEDAAIAASAEAVEEPTGYDDPETYSGDGDMKALTEAYDWEAEQFDEGATLFDEPALDATVITPDQPVTVPDAEVREPDEPEV